MMYISLSGIYKPNGYLYCGLYFIGTYIIAVYNYIKSESENADSSVFLRAHSCHQRQAINDSVTDKRVSQLYIQIIYIILLPMSRSEDDFFFRFRRDGVFGGGHIYSYYVIATTRII